MTHKTAVLSIHSIYAQAIYDGIKKYEVRKCSIEAETVYLYETMPVGLITGYIKIGRPIRMSVEDIKEYRKETLLTPNELEIYANGRSHLYLWPIIDAVRMRPRAIATRAPQSYFYMD